MRLTYIMNVCVVCVAATETEIKWNELFNERTCEITILCEYAPECFMNVYGRVKSITSRQLEYVYAEMDSDTDMDTATLHTPHFTLYGHKGRKAKPVAQDCNS